MWDTCEREDPRRSSTCDLPLPRRRRERPNRSPSLGQRRGRSRSRARGSPAAGGRGRCLATVEAVEAARSRPITSPRNESRRFADKSPLWEIARFASALASLTFPPYPSEPGLIPRPRVKMLCPNTVQASPLGLKRDKSIPARTGRGASIAGGWTVEAAGTDWTCREQPRALAAILGRISSHCITGRPSGSLPAATSIGVGGPP